MRDDEQENKASKLAVKSHEVKLKQLIEEANKDLSDQEILLQQNADQLRQIEVNKGVVVASTRDFQETCMVILNREYVLTCVVREIEKHQQHYKNQDECTYILNHEKTIENPSELDKVLEKIQQGIEFFKANQDYKKADIYLNRFEYLRQTALEKLNVRVLKVLRELNETNNLQVVQSNVLDTAEKISEIDIKTLIYALPPSQS